MYARIIISSDLLSEIDRIKYLASLSEDEFQTYIRAIYYVSNFVDTLSAEDYD
jgi:hypothetical protein